MRKVTISFLVGAVALTASGAALAQTRQAAPDTTRAAVEQRAIEAFSKLDVNGDGKIDTADREARQKARFERIDADNNGAISFAEFTATRSRPDVERAGRGERDGQRMGMRGGYHMGLRGNVDANQDGAVTQAEFTAAALARFDAADADNDGTVTATERKSQRAAMREQRRQRGVDPVS